MGQIKKKASGMRRYAILTTIQRQVRGQFARTFGVDQKKVNFVLDQLERCGFLHGVQHVSNNTSVVFFDIAKFLPFLLYFMGIFGA